MVYGWLESLSAHLMCFPLLMKLTELHRGADYTQHLHIAWCVFSRFLTRISWVAADMYALLLLWPLSNTWNRRSDFLTAAVMKSFIFWGSTMLLLVGWLLGLLFSPEDGSYMLLQNVAVGFHRTTWSCTLVDRSLHMKFHTEVSRLLLRIRCRRNVFTESLPSNKRLFWLHNSRFRTSCLNIIQKYRKENRFINLVGILVSLNKNLLNKQMRKEKCLGLAGKVLEMWQ
jgi:hypothetical protein